MKLLFQRERSSYLRSHIKRPSFVSLLYTRWYSALGNDTAALRLMPFLYLMHAEDILYFYILLRTLCAALSRFYFVGILATHVGKTFFPFFFFFLPFCLFAARQLRVHPAFSTIFIHCRVNNTVASTSNFLKLATTTSNCLMYLK